MIPIASALLDIVRDVRHAGISLLWRSMWPLDADNAWIVDPAEALQKRISKAA